MFLIPNVYMYLCMFFMCLEKQELISNSTSELVRYTELFQLVHLQAKFIRFLASIIQGRIFRQLETCIQISVFCLMMVFCYGCTCHLSFLILCLAAIAKIILIAALFGECTHTRYLCKLIVNCTFRYIVN